MTKAQERALRQSEIRTRLGEIEALPADKMTDEIAGETDTLIAELRSLEVQNRAGIVAGDEPEKRGTSADGGESAEIRSIVGRATMCRYFTAIMAGRGVQGAEAELDAALGFDSMQPGIPLMMWPEQRAAEQRADVATPAPGTVGVNLEPIRPMIFAPSLAESLGVRMPTVMGGTFATATITTALSAAPKGKGDDAEATAAALTVQTATVKRVSGRLSLTEEDVIAIGQGNFESSLRQNLSMVMSDRLDHQLLDGTGSGVNLHGLYRRVTFADAAAAVDSYADYLAHFHEGVHGVWAPNRRAVSAVVGIDTYKHMASVYRTTDSDMSAVDWAETKLGSFRTHDRVPAAASGAQKILLVRRGVPGVSIAVSPVFGRLMITDIYSGSASGTRYVTSHVLLGDVVVEQANAYTGRTAKIST